MTEHVIEEVRSLAPKADATSTVGRARQRAKLDGAMAAESARTTRATLALDGDVHGDAPVRRPRRGAYLVGAATALVVAAAVVLPISLQTHAPAAKAPRRAPVVMQLEAMRLQLPSSYRLSRATAASCPVLDVAFMSPDTSGASRTFSSRALTPPYASKIAAAATAEGGCIAMVLAPPYTPTSANPDPESGNFESHPPVQVGPYEGRAGTWTSYAKPSDVPTRQAALYVEIPVAGGQTQDLAVSANNLSVSALVALVAGGLSIAGSSNS